MPASVPETVTKQYVLNNS
uniref:Uncharacterized protein n=1 Tax=Rhizophora mucronata TaxID=61149 RepID=A0A2P2R1K2_RHIMU